MGGNHFQVQENDVQLFHLLLKLFVSGPNECVSRAEHLVRVFGHTLQIFDHVL